MGDRDAFSSLEVVWMIQEQAGRARTRFSGRSSEEHGNTVVWTEDSEGERLLLETLRRTRIQFTEVDGPPKNHPFNPFG